MSGLRAVNDRFRRVDLTGPDWGRLCVLNGLGGLALPVAAIAFSVLLGHHSSPATDAAKTGTKISAGLGGLIAPGILWFVGLFLGAVFLVLAFAILRDARTHRARRF